MRLPLLYSPRSTDRSATTTSDGAIILPHFSTANGDLRIPTSPRRVRARGPEDVMKTPIDEAIDSIRDVTAKIRASFERMHQTEIVFHRETHHLHGWIECIELEQAHVTQAYAMLFNTSAIHVQRVFRGFVARRIFRDALALQAVCKIQRAFRANQRRRAERRRKFRLLSKKVLRGLKGIGARQDLTHNELLNRVSHNMMIERQWRMAMGLADTESDLVRALYRRKFVRQRFMAVIHKVTTMNGIVRFWQQLVPLPLVVDDTPDTQEQVAEPIDIMLDYDVNPTDVENEEEKESNSAKPTLFSLAQQLTSPSKPKSTTTKPGRVTREDLRQKQKLYTQRIYEENMKKEAARAAQLEKQREQTRLAEEARKRQEQEQRRARLEQAMALRDDLERRGLLAIREFQSKKEEELRKEEEAQQRIAQAKQRIAQQVLSDETQLLLARKRRGTKLL